MLLSIWAPAWKTRPPVRFGRGQSDDRMHGRTDVADGRLRFYKMICMEQQQPNISIIVNSANSYREGERTYTTLLKACQGFLRISPPLAGVIRRDTRVRDAIRNQTSILRRHPNTEAAEDVLAIAARLSKE